MKTMVKAGAWALVGASVCLGGPVFAAAESAVAAVEFLEVVPPDAVSDATAGRAPTLGAPNTVDGPVAPLDLGLAGEVEPNGSSAQATPLSGSSTVLRANVFPANDQDMYSFAANAGDRVYAATQTLWDASASGDAVLELIASDGTTILETDNNDGTFNASSASLAGAVIPSAGTFYLRVRHNTATGTIRPYTLNFRLQSSAPVAEVEDNNSTATANALPASGHVSGTISAVSPGEADFYSLALNAGDSVFLSLDMNPERDANVWNGRLGFGLFGNPPSTQILLANDANAGASASDPNSEAFFFTVKDAGTYYVYVDSTIATGLGANATYNLSATVFPAVIPAGTCSTYTSTDVPQVIPTGPGQVNSTITIPGNPRIADLNVAINLNHTFIQDLDAHLISPAGNDNGLFTDIGSGTAGGTQTLMDVVLDDEAAVPPAFAMTASFHLQPELNYRLAWFDGEDAGGTWTLALRDDATGDGGTLNSWSITVCEPPPPPSCPIGFAETTVYSTDFETDAAGFTSSGTANEWERGLPSFVPLTSCNSGVNCFVTDLDNTYDASSNQDLLSPNINLTGLSAPVTVRWAQRFQIESASFDQSFVDIQQVGGAGPLRLWEWRDATMTNTVGNPASTIAESSGWSQMAVRADSFAGQNAELRFNLLSDTTVQHGGLAIDDVSVTACRALSADLAITKTNGTTTSVPGTSTTYTITASNAGADDVTGATVADTVPASLTCTWTCVGAGGGTCTAAGSGNLNDLVNLPAGGSVTYTASCAIAAGATGTLSNTATITSSITDPVPANNSATDTDTLTPQADLSITKTDGVTTVVAGSATTYTIVASNAGPSNAPGSTVADTAPAACTSFTWTCVGAGGGTCTANGSGSINDSVNLPVGGSVSYTASCAISAGAAGSLVNTATVSAAASVTEVNAANNSATDTDTLTAAGVVGVLSADLNFGSLTIGGDGQQILTITNTGGSPITINGLTAATAPFATVAGGSCGVTPFVLNAGASCTVLYRFTPTNPGTFTQIVTVSSDVGSVDVTLRGTGIALVRVPLDGTSSVILLTMLALGSMRVLRRRG